ncbi:MAG: CHASE2 domain-containing protein [Elainellaceae cyanobacterium]
MKSRSINFSSEIWAVLAIGLAVTGLVSGIRELGWLQPLELRAYDWMMRFRADRGRDPRLLIVSIGEADIRAQGRVSPSDEVLAQTLSILKQYQPRVIGLDLYRDVPQPPGTEQLSAYLQGSNVITITDLGDSPTNRIPPPSDVPPERVGFNDFVVDSDGVIRRNLILAADESGLFYSFALRVALKYIAEEQVRSPSQPQNPNYFQIGPKVIPPLDRDSGAYQNADVSGYQILLDYRSAQNVARQVSISDVLNQSINPDWFKDKIVLIGTTAPSRKDLFFTPYSAGEQADHQMAGVVIHAQMVSQIMSIALDDRPIFWWWANWLEIVWMCGWALGGASIAWALRHPLTLGAAMTGLIGLFGSASFIVFTHSGWVPVIEPILATLMTSGIVVAYRAQQAQRQQQMVMNLLGQNTSPEIAAALWKSRDRLLQSGKLPGQRLVATMLFTDIKDFSSLAERLPPEEVLNWLNDYLDAMTQVVNTHQGIINKFTGDGVLAVFGVPVPRLDTADIIQDAQRAVDCALAMGDRLDKLNQMWANQELPTAQMRVGIFTGPVVVGSLGGRERLEYGVIGDSVNIAARLESCAKDRQDAPCRILVAHETLVYLANRFEIESWGPMTLKGREQTIQVYRITGYQSAQQLTPDMTS